MTTVYGWTGREATLLRKALRLSVRDFAARLGVGARTVNKWEARQADITQLPYMQEVLDTALAQASDDVKARFAAAIHADVPKPASTQAHRSVIVPIAVGGQVVLVPIDAHTTTVCPVSPFPRDPAPDDDGDCGPDPGSRVTVSAPDAAVGKVASWVDRRDFGQHVAGLVLGAAGIAGLDIGRLLSLLPQAEPVGTRRIGAADVQAIEQITAAFRRQDFAQGSGPTRDAAVAQLRATLPLLDAQVSPALRSRLLIATAHLAMQTGWMSFQVRKDDAARRLWTVGLDLARNSEHPLRTDLNVYLLYDLALQAVHLGRPEDALHLVQIGNDAASGQHPVSRSTRGCLASIRAQAHAARGDKAECDRALGHAEEQFSALDPADIPAWGGHVSEAGMSAFHGRARYALADTIRDSRAASQAVGLLQRGVTQFGPAYARLQSTYLPALAGSHALAGDIDTAVVVGHQAIDAVAAQTSTRAYDHLRTLNRVLKPLHTSPGVADLRARLAAAAA